ncbi:unnamed protein product, partial [marine sediment metagenome]
YAQLTVNIIDFSDSDVQVTALSVNDVNYYGFEVRPFISEIGFHIDILPKSGRNYFAVELYNPSAHNIPLQDFVLELRDYNDLSVSTKIGFAPTDVIDADGCFVITNEPTAIFYRQPTLRSTKWKVDTRLVLLGGWIQPDMRMPPIVPIGPGAAHPRRHPPDLRSPPITVYWTESRDLLLRRRVNTGSVDVAGDPIPTWICVDKQLVWQTWAGTGDDVYVGRDARSWHIVYQTMIKAEDSENLRGSLGERNAFPTEGDFEE